MIVRGLLFTWKIHLKTNDVAYVYFFGVAPKIIFQQYKVLAGVSSVARDDQWRNRIVILRNI